MKQVFVNGREQSLDGAQAASVREVEPGVYSVLWNGHSLEARISARSGGYTVDIRKFRLTTEVRDRRDSTPRSKAAVGGERQNITAHMPGKVIRVLVSEGESVEAGQGLIVIEAMKMQNEMKAAKPGRVTEVKVRDGDTVAAGAVLITIA